MAFNSSPHSRPSVPTELQKDFLQSQYDYFQSQQWSLYHVELPMSDPEIYLFTDDDVALLKEQVKNKQRPGTYHLTPVSFSQYQKTFSSIEKKISWFQKKEERDNPSSLAFFNFYQEYPQYRSIAFPHYKSLTHDFGFTIGAIPTLIDNYTRSYEEAATLIQHLVSAGYLNAYCLSPEELCLVLEKKQANSKQVDDFLFDFYSSFPPEYLNNYNAYQLKNFLLKRFNYSKEQLSPYFSFFQPINRYFNPPEKNFMRYEHQFSTILAINLKDLSDYYCLDGFSKFDYQLTCVNLQKALTQYYQLEVNMESSPDDNMMFTFIHNNPDFTKEEGYRRLEQLYAYLSEKPDVNMSADLMVALFRQLDLENSLPATSHQLSLKKI